MAAKRAGELAAATGATVHVVCAYTGAPDRPIGGVGGDSFVVSSLTDGRADRRATGRHVPGQGIEATSAAIDEKPAAALLAEAARLEAEVIVVGNRRMQGVGRLLGSVANEVAHNAPCDVLIVKTV